MSEVAALAGVSATTVSHVLNNSRHVNDDTRLRVEEAVAALGYRRNSAARTLAGGSSLTIGLALSALTNPYFGPLLQTIEHRGSAAGYTLVLGDTHEDAAVEQRVIDSLLDRHVDGLIVAPSTGFLDSSAPRIAAAGVPLVLIDRALDIDRDQLTPENLRSTHMLTEHLLDHGHRRIAVVVGRAGLHSSAEREEGFRRAMAARGIEVEEALVLHGESTTEVAEREISQVLRGANPPTAVLTLNNSMTIGAMRAIRTAGLRIPHDLALAAYDDFEWSDLFEPGLTAIEQDIWTMGHAAVDTLLARIDGSKAPFERRVIETTFHRRTSCGCPTPEPARPSEGVAS